MIKIDENKDDLEALRIDKIRDDDTFQRYYDFEDYLYELWKDKDIEEADGKSSEPGKSNKGERI